MDFGSQVGAKLGKKIEPRQAKTGQDKGREGKRREGKGKEEEGKGLEGKGVEKCGWGLSARGGGGVRQTLRGRLRWVFNLFWVFYPFSGCVFIYMCLVCFVSCFSFLS